MTKAHDEMVERLMPILWQAGDIPWQKRLSITLNALTPADLALLAGRLQTSDLMELTNKLDLLCDERTRTDSDG